MNKTTEKTIDNVANTARKNKSKYIGERRKI